MATTLGTSTKTKLTVLLDSDVIMSYLKGKPELAKLFSPEVEASVRYAMNPIVLQELILGGALSLEGVDAEELIDKFEMLPVDEPTTQALVEELQPFDNKPPHPNTLLILAAGKNCDLLLSYDVRMREVGRAAGVEVLDPEEFLSRAGLNL